MAISLPASRSRLAAVAAVALGALLVAAPVQAEPYPMTGGTLASSAVDLEPGVPTTVSGAGFAPDVTVDITVESAPIHLASVPADATGAISTTVTIPTDLPAGTHTLKATGPTADGGTLVLSSQFVVGGDDSGLPKTGYPIGLLASISGVVLLGGLAVLGYGIRRRLRLSAPAAL
jgi:hypothetical protein